MNLFAQGSRSVLKTCAKNCKCGKYHKISQNRIKYSKAQACDCLFATDAKFYQREVSDKCRHTSHTNISQNALHL